MIHARTRAGRLCVRVRVRVGEGGDHGALGEGAVDRGDSVRVQVRAR